MLRCCCCHVICDRFHCRCLGGRCHLHLSYFTRGSILEHLNFASRTVIQRTKGGTRQTVGLSDNPFLVHTYVRYDGLAGIVVTQKDYAVRVAYSLLNKMMTDYEVRASEAKCSDNPQWLPLVLLWRQALIAPVSACLCRVRWRT